MAKIDITELVGAIKENKKKEKYRIVSYLFKNKNNHCYDIEFLETQNKQMATLQQIKNGTCYDLVEAKKQKRLKIEKELKERNRLVKKSDRDTLIPSDLKEKKVLAIDLSTTSTGIAYSVKGAIVRWSTLTSVKQDYRERCVEIIQELKKIIETGLVDIVILEDIYLGLNSEVLVKLAEARGMLLYHLQKREIEIVLIPAIWWKSKIEGIPHTRKEQKEFVKQKFFEYTGVKAESDDSADAFMMLKTVLDFEKKKSDLLW